MQELGDDKTSRPQRCVATGDGGCHNSEKCQDATKRSKPTLTDSGNHLGSLKREGSTQFLSGSSVEEIHRDCSPYQSNHAFGNHRTVEHRASHLLTLHTTGHQRRLCGMESTYRATGDSYEESGEYG